MTPEQTRAEREAALYASRLAAKGNSLAEINAKVWGKFPAVEIANRDQVLARGISLGQINSSLASMSGETSVDAIVSAHGLSVNPNPDDYNPSAVSQIRVKFRLDFPGKGPIYRYFDISLSKLGTIEDIADLAASAFAHIKEKYGNATVAIIGSPRLIF